MGREIFFFYDRPSRARFEAKPLRYCSALTDPVTGWRFRPNRRSPRLDFAGRPWFIVSDSTRTLFAAMPDSFLSASDTMLPREAIESEFGPTPEPGKAAELRTGSAQ